MVIGKAAPTSESAAVQTMLATLSRELNIQIVPGENNALAIVEALEWHDPAERINDLKAMVV